jgi:hypothetical protein
MGAAGGGPGRAPSSIPNEQRRYVALRGYFDGSGKNSPEYRAITLAGLSASEKVWPAFEQAWQEALEGLGFRQWRTSTLRTFMTDAAFYPAVSTLLDVISGFREAPMFACSATVLLDDYRRAKAEIPSLMPPEALCVNSCIGNLVIPTDDAVLPTEIRRHRFDHAAGLRSRPLHYSGRNIHCEFFLSPRMGSEQRERARSER